MTSDNKVMIEIAGEHNHLVDSTKKIERQVLRENCKRKATSSIATRPIKLIRNELMNSVSTELEHKDLKSVRKAMYIERRKNFPRYPSSLEDAITQLNELQNEEFLMFRGEKFVHLPEDSTFICLTTKENLQCLTSCTDVFTDGTFEYAPKFFLQLYTIHGYKNGIYVPLVYFFLKDKFKNTYINVWKYLINICEKQSLLFKIDILHIDFEIGAIQATKEVFLDVKIKTCRFHLEQAWWRKINGNTKLRTAYNDQKNDLQLWLKSFFGLSFIAPDDVVELISTCPNIADGQLFSDYVLETYVEPGCLFPPILWAETPSLNPRTTNGAESFHRTYNAQFTSAHPPTFVVISTLMETQAETVTKLSTISKRKIKPKSNEELKKIEFVSKQHKEYQKNKTPENLLNWYKQHESRKDKPKTDGGLVNDE
ncbi:uncharacterized protein LOC126555513 [Aphis gossypii]|uniref:uncharacterized protein LOC126555513 n=1 Tax=Aphis gossypii TaxID=80765 RepID=UPI002158BCB1|nr:uncharacterized protein LOC126555513 [Aphis gossypii]